LLTKPTDEKSFMANTFGVPSLCTASCKDGLAPAGKAMATADQSIGGGGGGGTEVSAGPAQELLMPGGVAKSGRYAAPLPGLGTRDGTLSTS
jgi:hypothetical protein